MQEIHRVLKPGGVFYASTFYQVLRPTNKENSGFNFFESPEEIKEYVSKGGFDGLTGKVIVRREGRGCVIIKAVKAPISTDIEKYFI